MRYLILALCLVACREAKGTPSDLATAPAGVVAVADSKPCATDDALSALETKVDALSAEVQGLQATQPPAPTVTTSETLAGLQAKSAYQENEIQALRAQVQALQAYVSQQGGVQ